MANISLETIIICFWDMTNTTRVYMEIHIDRWNVTQNISKLNLEHLGIRFSFRHKTKTTMKTIHSFIPGLLNSSQRNIWCYLVVTVNFSGIFLCVWRCLCSKYIKINLKMSILPLTLYWLCKSVTGKSVKLMNDRAEFLQDLMIKKQLEQDTSNQWILIKNQIHLLYNRAQSRKLEPPCGLHTCRHMRWV